MKIKMVGTGSIVAKERSACTLIDNEILVDCGNGTVKTLMEQGVNVNDIRVILITHFHIDHFYDLPMFIFTKLFGNNDKVTKIYGPLGTEKICEELFNKTMIDGDNFQKLKIKSNVEFFEFERLSAEEILEEYFVNSYVVDHCSKSPVYGYTIQKDNKIIGLSGDSNYCNNIDEILKTSDITVLDMNSLKGDNYHMGVDDIQNICKKYKDKKIIATHMTEQSRQYAKQIKIENLTIPNDGDEIEI